MMTITRMQSMLYFQRNDGKMGGVGLIALSVDSTWMRGKIHPDAFGWADLCAIKGGGPRWMAIGLGDSIKPPRVRKGRPVFPKCRSFIEFGAKVTRIEIGIPDPSHLAATEVALSLCGPTRHHTGKPA
jgi:hypothetical protein